MKWISSGFCFLWMLSLVGSGSAWADSSLSLGVVNSFVKDSSFDAFSTNDNLPQFEIVYARKARELGRGAFWVDGAYTVGSQPSKIFDKTIQMDILVQTVTLGLSYHRPLKPWLIPHLRLGLGVLVGSLEIKPISGEEVEDTAAAFTGQILAGCEILWLHPKVRKSYLRGGGIVVEAGYGFASAMGFELAPEKNDNLRQIPVAGTPVGSLRLNGAQIRVGGVLHF